MLAMFTQFNLAHHLGAVSINMTPVRVKHKFEQKIKISAIDNHIDLVSMEKLSVCVCKMYVSLTIAVFYKKCKTFNLIG